MRQTLSQQNIRLNLDAALYSAPAVITLASDIGAPVDIFNRLSHAAKHAFLLESTEGDDRLARYSFAGCNPVLTVTFQDDEVLINYRDSDEIIRQPLGDPLQFLQDLSNQFSMKLKQHVQPFTKLCGDLPFAGGLVGYMVTTLAVISKKFHSRPKIRCPLQKLIMDFTIVLLLLIINTDGYIFFLFEGKNMLMTCYREY